jgi:hypothetical protein
MDFLIFILALACCLVALLFGLKIGKSAYKSELLKRAFEEEVLIRIPEEYETYYLKVSRVMPSEVRIIQTGLGPIYKVKK